MEGSKELSALSAGCLLILCLSSTDIHESNFKYTGRPPSTLQQSFPLPSQPCGTSVPLYICYHSYDAQPTGKPRDIWWHDLRPSNQEHIRLARHMVEAAQAYQQAQRKKVPRGILRFALSSISLDPTPPPSVVANCLTILAIDLGYSVSDITTPNDRCVQI